MGRRYRRGKLAILTTMDTRCLKSLIWVLPWAAAACVPTGLDREELGDGHDQTVNVGDWQRLPVQDDFVVLDAVSVGSEAVRVVALIELGAPGDAPALEARLLPGGAWQALETKWSEEDHHVARLDLTESGEAVELRVPAAALEMITALRWSAEAVVEEEPVPETQVAPSAIGSELSGLGIVSRSQWGASSARCSMTSDPNKYRMAIHHTEGPSSNPQRQLRSIQNFHANKGWCDVGYHFLIDVSGTIYEGRELRRRGVHARNNNTGNIGISHIGSFQTTNPPAAMLASTARLVERLSQVYNIDLSRTRIKGHREYSSTDCPGDRLYAKINNIISDARTIRGGGGSPMPTPNPTPGGSCTHSFGGTYAHLGCSADYQCCNGVWATQTNGCGNCACTETSGQTGCQPPAPPPPPPTPTPQPGASCTHSFGGLYGHLACSADYQCCNGSWQTQANGCGSCACTEESGQTGCQPTPPAGQSCTHSFGGNYAHLGCSTGYQCCDGSWKSRNSGCGTCACVEGTGRTGCGGTTTPPPMSSTYLGLRHMGSDIPRQGLANGTLRSALGISTEPLGSVTTHEGAQYVRGKVSHFGGPNDTGVSSTETGAITGERLRSLNNPMSPSRSTLSSRPEDYYYAAMRWNYSPNGRTFWSTARFVVINPANNRKIVVRAVDWGPHTRTSRIIDLSPQALDDLGATTDDDLLVAFAPDGTRLGVH